MACARLAKCGEGRSSPRRSARRPLAGPATVVHTKDGSVYYGTLVERVVDDHVSILLATGEVKRFAMKDIDPRPAPASPLYRVPPSQDAPRETVRTKDGSVYYGSVVERVVGDHVTLELETGALQRVAWSDVDTAPAPSPPPAPRTPGPIENVSTVFGSMYHGEILERVVGDHVTIRLESGRIKVIPWKDVDLGGPRARPPADDNVMVDFVATPANAHLQQSVDGEWQDVCAGACYQAVSRRSLYRVAGEGLVSTKSFHLEQSTDSRVVAKLGSSAESAGGVGCLILAVPTLFVGAGFIGAAGSQSSYYGENTAFDVGTILLNVAGAALLAAGIYLDVHSRSSVALNGSTLARIATEGVRF